MAIKLVEPKVGKTIPMKYLMGGKLAVVSDPNEPDYNDLIVTRDCDSGKFVILGELDSFNDEQKLSNGFADNINMQVRVLDEGELLKVEYSGEIDEEKDN
jgi:hypothetical protein